MTAAYLSELVQKTTVEDAWQSHLAQMSAYGFDRLLYGFTRFRTPTSFGDRQDALILSNHSDAYLEHYLGDGHFRHGPMVRWAETHDGACSWAHLASRANGPDLSDNERHVVASNRDFGVTHGYTISFRNLSRGAFGAIGMAGRRDLTQSDLDKTWAAHGDDILLMNRVFHLAVISLPATDTNRLTPRQREVLEWVAQGKTVPEICTLIGRKQATVEKHLRLAREAMNAQTTAQAVVKASIQNQIFSYSPIEGMNFTNR